MCKNLSFLKEEKDSDGFITYYFVNKDLGIKIRLLNKISFRMLEIYKNNKLVFCPYSYNKSLSKTFSFLEKIYIKHKIWLAVKKREKEVRNKNRNLLFSKGEMMF